MGPWNRPEDDLGAGGPAPDCAHSDGGAMCVRAERQGIDPAGRFDGLLIEAIHVCGNARTRTVIGEIYVSHDQSPHEDCLKTNVVGRKGPGRP